MLQGQRDQQTVARLLMSELTPLVEAQHGAFYVAERSGDDEDETELRLVASYGYKERKSLSNRFRVGEALVGQAALERKSIVITEAPSDYIKISSGLGEARLADDRRAARPLRGHGDGGDRPRVLHALHPGARRVPRPVVQSIGVVHSTIQANMRTEEPASPAAWSAEDLQSQSEELQAQQDELRRSNSELESRAATLRASEELLQTQQEELQQTNEELEERSQQLEEQNRRIEIKNTEIEEARRALEGEADARARRGTSPSSSRTCRTSCGRRSTRS